MTNEGPYLDSESILALWSYFDSRFPPGPVSGLWSLHLNLLGSLYDMVTQVIVDCGHYMGYSHCFQA